jgi:hypothetical protein
MNILARVLGFSKPESQNFENLASSSSVAPTAARQQQGEGGITIFKRLLKDDSDDSDSDDFDECPNTREESSKKARGSDAEVWAGNCSADAITTALAGKCCQYLCVQNYLTVGGVKRFRTANANRSSGERRVYARLLIRSMVQPSENVPLPLLILLASFYSSIL